MGNSAHVRAMVRVVAELVVETMHSSLASGHDARKGAALVANRDVHKTLNVRNARATNT